MLRAGPPASARNRNGDLFDGAFGAVYSFYIRRRRLSRLIAAVVWGADIGPFHDGIDALGEVPDGSVIVDLPCGAGVAFDGLRPDQRLRYVALDLSPRMLARASERAQDLGLTRIEVAEADAQAIPVEAGSVDLFLSYWGLHCFPDPAAAVAEVARCLRPGGRAVGSMITRGRTARHRLLVRPGFGGFGPGGTVDDLRGWLERVGLEQVRLEVSGLFAYFEAAKPLGA